MTSVDGRNNGEEKPNSDHAHTAGLNGGQANVTGVAGVVDGNQGDTIHSSNAHAQDRKPAAAAMFAPSSSMDSNESSAQGSQRGLQPNENLSGSGIGIGKPKKNHGRNVSWGVFPKEGVVRVPATASGAPFLSPEDAAILGDAVQPSAVQQNQQQKPGGTTSNKERIELYDVINHEPVEPESETMLLHKLQNETVADDQGASEKHDILPNVPDEAIKRGLSFKRGMSFKPSFRVSRRTLGDGSRNSRQQQQHKRTQTLEDRLVGLADALDALHSIPDPMEMDIASPPADRFSVASNSTVGAHNTETLLASAASKPNSAALTEAERLQQNATMLLAKHAAINSGEENSKDGQKNDEASSSAVAVADSVPAILASELSIHNLGGLSTISSEEKEDEEDDRNNKGKSYVSDIEGGQQPSGADKDTGNGAGPPPENKQTNSASQEQGKEGMKLKQNTLMQEFDGFIDQTSTSIRSYVRMAGQYIFFPSLALAGILFYFADNPPTGVWDNDDDINSALEEALGNINVTLPTDLVIVATGEEPPRATASVSWWLLFFGVRQLLTFSLSLLLEMFVIDFLSIRSQFSVRNFGPWVTLFILQSRGWPFRMFCWAGVDLVLLAGSHPFFSHWLYWQDYIKLFNESNPGGNIVDSEQNHRVLAIAMSVGAVVAVKRFWIGLYLGRQTYGQFADRLASLMKKIIIISEVSYLGRTIRRQVQTFGIVRFKCGGLGEGKLADLLDNTAATDGEGDENKTYRSTVADDANIVVDSSDRDPLTQKLSNAQKTRIAQILGAWEEPLAPNEGVSAASVTSILQFRRALSSLKTRYPFSSAFGLADSRENCIEAAQEVYEELMMRTPDAEFLNFDTLALLAVQADGSIDQQKLEDMVRLFRPDRDGTITMIDFVKSVDRVYRNLRLFNASVVNSSKIDNAFESIINVAFYTIVVTVILSQLGFDPLALFLSVSGVILAFAFMIGTASSKYFEGLLFILVRRPYSIGDAIHISNVNNDTSGSGSAWWTVEDINLFTTKVNFLFTGERATLSNGSLANSRIINSSRSSNASLFITMKFAVDVPHAKIKLLEQAAIEFVHRRPREWLSWGLFRASRVDAEQGFIEYIIGAVHRETWSHWGTVQNSKAQLAIFCLEASKALGIDYHAPTVPITLQNATGPLESLQLAKEVDPLAVPPVDQVEENVAEKYGMQLSALQDRFAPSN